MERVQAADTMWALAHFLVTRKGYQLLQVQKQKENLLESDPKPVIHLVKKENHELRYIRLALADYVWSSVMERNVKETVATADLFRQKMHAARLYGLNLYFFAEEPMPDVRSRLEEMGKVRIKENTYLQSGLIDLPTRTIWGEQLDLPLFHLTQQELQQILLEPPLHGEAYLQDLLLQEQERQREVKRFFFRSQPVWTYLLIGVNLFLFLLMTLYGGSEEAEVLIRFGAKFNPEIVDGEWWRLFTAMFLHIGFLHLAFNSVALYWLGNAVERMYGPLRFLFVYLFSGLAGSVLSFALNPHLSAGASGAIYGLFGALLYFGVRRRDLFLQTIGKEILAILGINLGFTLLVPSIDVYGHIGGLAGGFLAAAAVGLPQFEKRLWRQGLLLLLAFFLLIAGFYWGLERNRENVEVQLYRAEKRLFDLKDYPEAEQLLEPLVYKRSRHQDVVHYYLAVAQIHQNKTEQAKHNLQQALQINPEFPEALYALAAIFYNESDLKTAESYLSELLRIAPDHEQGRKLYEQIRSRS